MNETTKIFSYLVKIVRIEFTIHPLLSMSGWIKKEEGRQRRNLIKERKEVTRKTEGGRNSV